MLERTLFILKPDAVSRWLEREIIKRVKDLKIVKQKKISVSLEQAQKLYAVHKGKPFYDGLIKFITSGPVIACVVEGEDAILRLRKIMGATDPMKAEVGTIRGDLKEENVLSPYGTIKNLVHGSDSKESADYEIPIFF